MNEKIYLYYLLFIMSPRAECSSWSTSLALPRHYAFWHRGHISSLMPPFLSIAEYHGLVSVVPGLHHFGAYRVQFLLGHLHQWSILLLADSLGIGLAARLQAACLALRQRSVQSHQIHRDRLGCVGWRDVQGHFVVAKEDVRGTEMGRGRGGEGGESSLP